jgi:hypothetical protein
MYVKATIDQRRVRESITTLLSTARAANLADRRVEPRYPFFQPLAIQPRRTGCHQFSAFSRDISESGMGLLHNMPLDTEEVILTISGDDGAFVLPGQIMWCRPCGEGWYLSGAKFHRAEPTA